MIFSHLEAEVVYIEYEALGKEHHEEVILRYVDEGWYGVALSLLKECGNQVSQTLYTTVIRETLLSREAPLFDQELSCALEAMAEMGHARTQELFEGVILLCRDLKVDEKCRAAVWSLMNSPTSFTYLDMLPRNMECPSTLVKPLLESNPQLVPRLFNEIVAKGNCSLDDPQFLSSLITALMTCDMKNEALSFYMLLPEIDRLALGEAVRSSLEEGISTWCTSRPWECWRLFERGELSADGMARTYANAGWYSSALDMLAKDYKCSEEVYVEVMAKTLPIKSLEEERRRALSMMERAGYGLQMEIWDDVDPQWSSGHARLLYELYSEMVDKGVPLATLTCSTVVTLITSKGFEVALSHGITLNAELCMKVLCVWDHWMDNTARLALLRLQNNTVISPKTLDKGIRRLAYRGFVKEALSLWKQKSSKPIAWLVESTDTPEQAYEVVRHCKESRCNVEEAVEVLLSRTKMRKRRMPFIHNRWSIPPPCLRLMFHEIVASGHCPTMGGKLKKLLVEKLSKIGLHNEAHCVARYKSQQVPCGVPAAEYPNVETVLGVLFAHIDVWSLHQLHEAVGDEVSRDMVVARYVQERWNGMALYTLRDTGSRDAYYHAIQATLASGRASCYQEELITAFERMHELGHARSMELFRDMILHCVYDDPKVLCKLYASMVEELGMASPDVEARCSEVLNKLSAKSELRSMLQFVLWLKDLKQPRLLNEAVEALLEMFWKHDHVYDQEEQWHEYSSEDEDGYEEYCATECASCCDFIQVREEVSQLFERIISVGECNLQDPKLLILLADVLFKHDMLNEALSFYKRLSEEDREALDPKTQECLLAKLDEKETNLPTIWEMWLAPGELDYYKLAERYIDEGWYSKVVEMLENETGLIDAETCNRIALALARRTPGARLKTLLQRLSWAIKDEYELEVYRLLVSSSTAGEGFSFFGHMFMKSDAPEGVEYLLEIQGWSKHVLHVNGRSLVDYIIENEIPVRVEVFETVKLEIMEMVSAWISQKLFSIKMIKFFSSRGIVIPEEVEERVFEKLSGSPLAAFELWQETGSRLRASKIVQLMASGEDRLTLLRCFKDNGYDLEKPVHAFIGSFTDGGCMHVKKFFHEFIARGRFVIRGAELRIKLVDALLKVGLENEATSLSRASKEQSL